MTRHASLADQLKALLAYRSRPEGAPPQTKTNWDPVAANDNSSERPEDLYIERRRAMRPTPKEIMDEVEKDDVERNESGQIVRIGRLRFSDGTQTEKALRYSIDGKLIEYDAPMPVGAMLHTRDRQERMLGGDTISSNTSYTAAYGGKHPNTVKRKPVEKRKAEKPAPPKSKAEMRAEINALPDFPVTTCKKGFPWQPARLRELFAGLEKAKKGEAGSIAWEDISTHIVEREVWAETIAALGDEDKATLEAAMAAKSMADLSGGTKGGSSYKKGKKRLLATNDNLVAAYKKSAA